MSDIPKLLARYDKWAHKTPSLGEHHELAILCSDLAAALRELTEAEKGRTVRDTLVSDFGFESLDDWVCSWMGDEEAIGEVDTLIACLYSALLSARATARIAEMQVEKLRGK